MSRITKGSRLSRAAVLNTESALSSFQPCGVKNSGPFSGANFSGAWLICAPILFWSILMSAGDPKSKSQC